jgi:thiol-disulfide isomerase/thioredoxin
MKAAPANAARYDAALFEAMVGRAREMAGVPAPAKAAISLDDILKAEDAKPETKSQASLINVMEAAEAAEGPEGDTAVWIAKAEKHLKDFPAEKMNRMVEGKVKSLKAAAEIKTKPLEMKFTAVDGREVDLAKLQGKVVLIDFWATWCGPCVAELPNVIKAYKELHPKGFEIVGISLDSDKAELEAFVKDKGMEWPQYFDGKGWQNEISTKYGINSIPAMWLLNKKGMVVSTNARGGLEEQVAKLLAE